MRTESVETFTVKNVTVNIYPDHEQHDCPIDKNLEADGVRFVTFQKRSTLSNLHDFASPDDVLPWAKENGWDAFPLYYYEHGLCRYSASDTGNPFSCPWDSGQAGWILVKRSAFDKDRLGVAQSWANAVTTWCNNDYYGYVVEDQDGEHLDSCWGYDDFDYCKQEATHAAESEAKRLDNKMRDEQQEAYENLIVM